MVLRRNRQEGQEPPAPCTRPGLATASHFRIGRHPGLTGSPVQLPEPTGMGAWHWTERFLCRARGQGQRPAPFHPGLPAPDGASQAHCWLLESGLGAVRAPPPRHLLAPVGVGGSARSWQGRTPPPSLPHSLALSPLPRFSLSRAASLQAPWAGLVRVYRKESLPLGPARPC